MAQIIKKIKGQEYLYEIKSFRENGKVKKRITKYYGNIKKPSNNLIFKQNLTLEKKIEYSLQKIDEFHEHMNGKVYISFSGGKDSTVLLDLVRSIYPDTPAVFVDTGLEYPEIRDFVKTIPNVIWLKPEMSFKKVLEIYGYPVVSKLVSTQIRVLRNPTPENEYTRNIYLHGYRATDKRFKFNDKWAFLLDAPFKISEKCCRVMKHKPIERFEKEYGLKPYIGTMAADSMQRTTNYCKTGCNSFGRDAMSRPLSIWNESDVWNYVEKFELEYSRIYDMGVRRTGCMFCMFGIHLESNNRFEMMKKTHPVQYEYCMTKLNLKPVLEFINAGLIQT